MSDSNRSHFESVEDVASTEYRAVSGLAILGLLLGLLSAAAIFHPGLCLIALAAVVVNVVALRKIGANSAVLIGRKMALVGVTLAVAFATVGPSHWYTSRWFLQREAQRFAAVWFEILAQNKPHIAYQYGWMASQRWPFDDGIMERYGEDPEVLDQLREYTRSPDVRALLALGEDAEVRFNKTEFQGRGRGSDDVIQSYAVTYTEEGVKKTFFVVLTLARRIPEDSARAEWRVTDHSAGRRPGSDD